VFKNIIGLDDKPDQAEFNMNILGEYNIGGDAWKIDTLLRKCGIHFTSTLSGDVSYAQVAKAHTVQLNGVMCHRSINYLAEMMEKKNWHSVDQSKFHRGGSDVKNAPQDCKIFRQQKADGSRRGSHRAGNAGAAARAR
jgi:nitrogenase molybdenum-iron protein alpha chain